MDNNRIRKTSRELSLTRRSVCTEEQERLLSDLEQEDDTLRRFLCEHTGQNLIAGEYAIGIIRETGKMVTAVWEPRLFRRQFQSMADTAQKMLAKHLLQV